MIAPALPRWIAELLAAPGTGVNALAPLVPRGPLDPDPPPVAIYNAVDDAWVARKFIATEEATPEEWVLFVRVGEEVQLAGDAGSGSMEDSASIIVELNGVTIEADNAQALATGYRVMRAVRRCLRQAFIALRGEDLSLEGEQIELPTALQGFTLAGQPGSGQVSLALAVPFTLTDTWALGAEET